MVNTYVTAGAMKVMCLGFLRKMRVASRIIRSSPPAACMAAAAQTTAMIISITSMGGLVGWSWKPKVSTARPSPPKTPRPMPPACAPTRMHNKTMTN